MTVWHTLLWIFPYLVYLCRGAFIFLFSPVSFSTSLGTMAIFRPCKRLLFFKDKCQLLSSVLQISVLDQGLGCDVSCWVVLHQLWIERRKAPWWWWLWRRCWDGGPPGDVDCDDTEHAEHTSLATWGFYRSRLSHSVSHWVSLNKITIISFTSQWTDPNAKSCVNTQNIMNDFK